MKKYQILFSVLFSIVILTGCEWIIDNKTTDNISQISVYPIFKMNGDKLMIVQKGQSYTDPGVVASEVKAGDNDLNVVVKGTVDTNTPNLYTLTYVASNKFGYKDSVMRSILVTEGDPDLNPDLTGSYKQKTYTMTVSKLSKGFWHCSRIFDPRDYPGDLADIGNGNYVIVPGTYNYTSSGVTFAGSYSGTAKLVETGLEFIITQKGSDGVTLTKKVTWVKKP